jgi:hypothetical protein
MKNDKRPNVFDFLESSQDRKTSLCDVWNAAIHKADAADRCCWLIFHRDKTRLDYIIVDSYFWWTLCRYAQKQIDNRLEIDDAYIMELEAFLTEFKPWEVAGAFLGRKKGKEVKGNYYFMSAE